MSYRTIGYDNGRAIKVDEGPAYGGSVKLGGALVVGDTTVTSKHWGPRVQVGTRPRITTIRPGCALVGSCRHRPCTDSRAFEARRLHGTSMTVDDIAQALSRTPWTVRYWLRNYPEPAP